MLIQIKGGVCEPMNYLRRRFASLLPRKHPSELIERKNEKLEEMIARYKKAEDEEDKKEQLEKIFERIPKTLFLAAVCFPEDDPAKSVMDRTLHASPGSKGLYEENKVVLMNGNPFYKPARKDSGKRMHLRMLVGKTSGESFVPVFTDFAHYMKLFGIKSRVALFTLREVREMCQQGQGILINPGENALIIKPTELWRIK